jgi:hypothetical protein
VARARERKRQSCGPGEAQDGSRGDCLDRNREGEEETMMLPLFMIGFAGLALVVLLAFEER